MFPLQRGTSRLAVQLPAVGGDPWLGPASYLGQEVVTPAPASYQPFWNRERRFQPAFAPFATKAPRFPAKPSEKELFPGPGTYDVGKQLHKKVTWPMKFGSPDWSLVPMPAKRMLKMEVQKLTIDRAFRKNQDRVAYLSLYYS
ncbi:ciliary microtubule-associated protein 3 isoform X2 [Pogoniulus pusillus]|uniref:ciliary microtubule-associated protein 3 isoform X2 n=1 Tax=Pogoniulus pusillus TaxID=488313 RepID=UPI0030B96E4B